MDGHGSRARNSVPSRNRKRRIRTIRDAAAASIALALLFAGADVARATTGTWNLDAAGNWSATGSWLNGIVPGAAAGDVANLSFNITATRIVTLDATETLGTLNIGDTNTSNSYTLSGTAVLTLDNSGSDAIIMQSATSTGDTISVPIVLNSSLDITDLRTANTITLTFNTTGSISAGTAGLKTISNLGSAAGNTTISATIADGSGQIAVTQNNAADIFTLSSANSTYTGATTISAGVLSVNTLANIGVKSSLGFGLNTSTATNQASLVLQGGTLKYTGGAVSTDRLFTLGIGVTAGTLDGSGSGAVNFTNTNAIAFSGSGTRTLILTGSSTAANTLGALIGDSGGATTVSKIGAGTWDLSNSGNSFTGGSTISAGVLQFNSAGATSSADSVRDITATATGTVALNFTGIQNTLNTRIATASAGTIALTTASAAENVNFSSGGANFASAFLGATGSVTYTGTITPNGTTYRLGGGGGTLTLPTGALVTGTSLLVGGPNGGIVALTGSNGYNAGTNISANTLNFTAASALGTGLVTFTGNSTLQWGTSNTADVSTINGLKISDGITATLDIGANNVNLGTAIQTGAGGSGALVKLGTGTLTLGASQTYTGGTTVLAGTLASSVSDPLSHSGALTLGSATNTAAVTADFTNASPTVASLNVGSNSTTNLNTVTIGSGKTLTIGGNVLLGIASSTGAVSTSLVTFNGGGNLVVNKTGGTFQVGGVTINTTSDGNAVTADLTALAGVSVDMGSTGSMHVGDSNFTGSGNSNAQAPVGATSILKLPASATLKAGTVGVADLYSGAATDTLNLGSGTNTIQANTIFLGAGAAASGDNPRGTGVLQFGSANGSLTVTAYDGTSPATLNIINTSTNTSLVTNATFDTSGGHVANLTLGTVTVAQRSGGGTGSTTGTFKYDAGTSTATNFVVASRITSGAAGNIIGNVTINGGTFSIGTLNAPPATGGILLAQNTTSSGVSTGNLTIGGGTITIGATSGVAMTMSNASVALGTATSVLTITGGTTTFQGNIVGGATTGTSNTSLTLNGASAVLDLGGNNIGSAAVPIGGGTGALAFQTGTLQNVNLINGTAGVTKNTAGTLSLAGTDNYTGATAVSAGTLLVNGNLTATSSVTVANATLGGNGTIKPTGSTAANNISLASSAILSPGNNAVGTLTIDRSATSASSVLSITSGASLSYELNTGFQSDKVALINGTTSDISFGGNAINFTDLSGGSLPSGNYTLFTANDSGAYTGLTVNGSNVITGGLTIGSGLGAYPGSTLQVSGNNIVLNVTPEPATISLLGLQCGLLLARRRRRVG